MVRLSLLVTFVSLLVACASERVVLLPSPDGRPTALVVRDGGGETVLDQPYAASARHFGENRPYLSTPAEITAHFSAALAAQPARARSYVLYFIEGGNQLTAQSQADLQRVLAEIKAWPAGEVMVIGHTDSVGSLQANDALSLRRALMVRQLLNDAGIPADRMESVGRGERELLVPTADEVSEAQNRRVEINLR